MELVRQILAKRLRPGQLPEDVVIEVMELSAPELPESSAAVGPSTFFYRVEVENGKVWVDRMKDIEISYGSETVFEDQLGNCYVSASAFEKRSRRGL